MMNETATIARDLIVGSMSPNRIGEHIDVPSAIRIAREVLVDSGSAKECPECRGLMCIVVNYRDDWIRWECEECTHVEATEHREPWTEEDKADKE